jgi:hypothetical protein
MTAVAQIPGLRNQALGSIAHRLDGTPVGSTLIGSSSPTPTEIPSPGTSRPGRRPRATATTRPPARRATSAPRTWSTPCPAIPRTRPRGKQSLLTRFCQRSKEVDTPEGVDGSRPFCTLDGVGAVLGVVRSGGPDRPGGQPRPGLPGGSLPHYLLGHYLLGRRRGVRDTRHRLHQGCGHLRARQRPRPAGRALSRLDSVSRRFPACTGTREPGVTTGSAICGAGGGAVGASRGLICGM